MQVVHPMAINLSGVNSMDKATHDHAIDSATTNHEGSPQAYVPVSHSTYIPMYNNLDMVSYYSTLDMVLFIANGTPAILQSCRYGRRKIYLLFIHPPFSIDSLVAIACRLVALRVACCHQNDSS